MGTCADTSKIRLFAISSGYYLAYRSDIWTALPGLMLMIVDVGLNNETGTNALFLLTMTESQSPLPNIILHQYGPGGEHPLLPEK